MNRTTRTTAVALGVGALLAGGLAVGQAFAAPSDPPAGTALGIGNAYGNGPGTPRGQAYRAPTQNRNATTSTPSTQAATASAELAEALAFSREEEQMARDLYAAIADLYDGARPFSMITKSEQNHFDAIGTLLDRYGVDDPAEDARAGVFENPDIQALYDGWWEDAQKSLEDAYQVGIELEQRDIADLEKMIDADHPSDVDTVLGHLLEGSENHLAAYQRAADGDLGTGAGPQNPGGRYTGMMRGPRYAS
jgi:hypothetical protein